MKYLPKTARALLILSISVIVILFAAALLMQDKVSGIILSILNRNVSTKVEVESMKLSFLRSFPKASVELRNVVVHSSKGFNTADFPGKGTDTLLFAESVFVIFHPLDIYRGNYNIEAIDARTGTITLLEDLAGKVNYNVSTGNNSDTAAVSINLDKINLSGMKAEYLNQSNGFKINGLIRAGKLKSKIKGSTIEFSAESDVQIDSLRISGTPVKHSFTAEVDLSLLSNSEGITFAKSSLAVDGYNFGVEGTISSENVYDLVITGNNVDITGFTRYLPQKFYEKASEYNPSGKLAVSCTIRGQVTKTRNPHVELQCSLKDGRITYSGSGSEIDKISFEGLLTNGAANNYRTSILELNNVSIHLGSSGYTGTFKTRNFDNPTTEIVLRGKVFPAEIIDFFDIAGVTVCSGTIETDVKVITKHRLRDSIDINTFIDMQSEGTMVFNSFELGLEKPAILFRNVNGSLSVSDIYKTPGLSFDYAGQRIVYKGDVRNLPEWLAGRPVTLFAAGDVSFNRFMPDAYTSHTDASASKGVNFPTDMMLDINFMIDSLRYKTFSSSAIKGSLTYKPRLLTFRSLNFKSLEGSVSGNGFIVQNSNKAFVSRGDFSINGIDIIQAFATFNNFGQSFIVRENLSGKLSGSISVLLPLNPEFRPRPKELTAEGKYIITDGALINFEPVKKLSSFIELSELENIHFDKLENDFFIRNNALVIPKMDVKSSAADLTVNGRHSFDNNYEYHVKILLSQLLSKKRKAARKPVTEFGAVKDDGLGRTSLLLKVVNRGEDVKVSYDIKAVSQEVNSNLLNEKKQLKNMLNEEYGWYDDEVKQPEKPTESKKSTRFNISWEETDSVNPPIKEQEEKGFRNLFRKK